MAKIVNVLPKKADTILDTASQPGTWNAGSNFSTVIGLRVQWTSIVFGLGAWYTPPSQTRMSLCPGHQSPALTPVTKPFGAYASLYCCGVRYFSEYAGRAVLKNVMYAATSCPAGLSPVRWRSMKISALIHPLMNSIAALSVGVPALDISPDGFWHSAICIHEKDNGDGILRTAPGCWVMLLYALAGKSPDSFSITGYSRCR